MRKGDIKKGLTYLVQDRSRVRRMVCVRVATGRGPCVTMKEMVVARRYNDDGTVKKEQVERREIVVTTRQVIQEVERSDEEWHR